LADEIPLVVDSVVARTALGLAPPGRLLALLPGSREGEVALLGPLFLQAATLLLELDPQLTFVIPAASASRHAQLAQLLAGFPALPVTLVAGHSREVMTAADAVLLASGTATLEAALLKRPMVVAYRMGGLSWLLMSRLVKTPWVALPNILAGRPVVPELLQRGATPEAVVAALGPLLAGEQPAREQLAGFDAIHRQLQRDYADRAAAALVELISCAPGDSNG
jgi:lipid-A-disaccharide synthase